MFPGHFKIDGHSNVKNQKGFLGPKQLQDKKARVKGNVSSNRRWRRNNKKEQRTDKIITLATFLLFLILAGMLAAGPVFDKVPKAINPDHTAEMTRQQMLDQMVEKEVLRCMERGDGFSRTGDFEGALEEYHRALELDPAYVEACEKIQEIMAN